MQREPKTAFNRKKLLTHLIAAGGCAILIGACWPLVKSLSPNAKSRANISSFNLDEVPIGTIRVFEDEDFALVVARPLDKVFSIFHASLQTNFASPFYFIYPGGMECSTFALKEDGIACVFRGNIVMEWSFDGTPKEKYNWFIFSLDLYPYKVTRNRVEYGPGVRK